MPSVFIFKYNNYQNRQLKRSDVLGGYGGYVYLETGNSVNFNPSDGVTTSWVAGRQSHPYYGNGDYLIYSEDNTNISSRWFITEQTRNLYGQYKCTLRRDVVAEYWQEIIGSPMFIEKATIDDNSPFIYNREDITVNQIKQGPDHLIKDETGIPWICGYFLPGKEMTGSTSLTKYDRVVAGLNTDPYYQYTSTDYIGPMQSYNYLVAGKGTFGNALGLKEDVVQIMRPDYWRNRTYDQKTDFGGIFYAGSVMDPHEITFEYTYKQNQNVYWDYAQKIWDKVKAKSAQMEASIKDFVPYHTESEYNALIAQSDDIIYDSTNQKYYKMKVVSYGKKNIYANARGTIALAFDEADIFTIDGISGQIGGYDLGLSVYAPIYRIVYEEVQGEAVTLTISAAAQKVSDAPYAIFAMPYGAIDIYKSGTKELTTNAETQMNMATELFLKYGAGDGKILYDLTLMPYCPCRGAITADGKFDIADFDVFYLQAGDVKKGVAIMAKSSTFSLSIAHNISLSNKKIDNETEVYRIVSPDYSSQFDFSIAKNNGLKGFNIDCTYKPFTPYVQVAPIFNGLYGSDWQDARGLICGFSFSLPVLSNAWESYQLSNVNFQKIFDRETQYLEVKNKYSNAQQIVSSIVGAGASGVMAGMAMGPYAGIAAGVASGVGGAIDYGITKRLQGEALDYRRDLFGFQLGNIQALPNSLAKVGAFVANNKIFPFLEHYTCTDEEKEAVANKIAWNGMTVGTIGLLIDYINNTWSYGDITDKGYIKGQLIRFDGCDDAHELAALQNELNEGVYLK